MKNVKSLRELGLGYLTYCEPNEAVQHLLDLLKNDSTNTDILMLLGDWYLTAGDGGAANVFYQRAAQLQPISLPSKTITLGLQREKWLEKSGLPLGEQGAKIFLASLSKNVVQHSSEAHLVLLEQIMSAADPATAVQQHIKEVLAHLPDLIAFNAVHARQEGKVELACLLEQLAHDAAR